MDPVIIVGGGAAGIIAAWRSAGLRAPTLLLEKNERLGIKLHISGGGKCNITHAGRMHDIRWARELGHSLVPLRAALAPIYLDPAPPADWSGVAVRDCLLRARAGGKVISRWRSDLLFTHKGISGPTALGVSRDVALALEHG